MRRLGLLGLAALLVALGAAGLASADVRAVIGFLLDLPGKPVAASPPVLSDHEIEQLDALSKQAQAQRLIERAVNHYQRALDQIAERAPGWYGGIELTKDLDSILSVAYCSTDLRVRTAAIEITLAARNVPKTPQSVDAAIEALDRDREDRAWRLWTLGLLGNRGVETTRIHRKLVDQLRDPDEGTRYWAVKALALLGTDETIEPLLNVFHDDPAPGVRERAARSLAQSGMLSEQQRGKAVPRLLDFMDDPALDPRTRSWVFQALRDITGRGIGADPAAWRAWQAQIR